MVIEFKPRSRLADKEEAKIQKAIASDPDAPEATDEQLAQAVPFRQAFPDLAESIDREVAKRGRPKADKVKKSVTIRLDPDLVEHYQSTGKGWQSRMNDDLRKAAGM
ncbi:BrnA antitoxin family protein [Rhizobium rhizogenes]|uniref:BrnA antitoxin family protein n=1 Tax=Rhizobium rhizogenes TaxID=359 RepID=UPI0022C20AC2|nr:BrnA antitoxin family protein [Rhizobium rhizogenes]MCZ7488524.1 BrnA antitoxin family protein [Rhizobium rhizogenes]